MLLIGESPDSFKVVSGRVYSVGVNSLTTKKQTTKFLSANFQKILNPS